ncbi:MAG: PspC domain-containing protein, partial [Enterococcus sp.]|nr:PspC domain-containing protein [Enterococcus sp.]
MKKRLAKSQKNKMLTGTLAGIAEYYDIDPTIVRVLYIFISIVLVGAPILLYIL